MVCFHASFSSTAPPPPFLLILLKTFMTFCLRLFVLHRFSQLHGPSMFAFKAKTYGLLCNQFSSVAFDETSSYLSAPKAPNFSAFHWSPHGSLVFICQHFVTTRVVHVPKRTETSLIIKSDQIGINQQLLQICTASTAWWSDSDQAVRAVHSSNSWFCSTIKEIIQFTPKRANYFL